MSLLDAAKGWLKRLHGSAEKTTAGVTNIAWSKSEKELQEERTEAMTAVMVDVDGCCGNCGFTAACPFTRF